MLLSHDASTQYFLNPYNFLQGFIDDAQMHKFRKVTKFQFTKSGLPCNAQQLFLLPKRFPQSDGP